jgi:GNAT superfamily N-acetyltransferase
MIQELDTPTVTTIEPMDINVTLRSGAPDDAARCGLICYEAFRTIAGQHNFPPDFPDPDAAIGLMSQLLERQNIYAVVAEVAGRVVGSNFLWEGDAIAGVGPITVDPRMQSIAVGRRLMEAVLRRAEDQHVAVRLVQAAYHSRSLSLYSKLGFTTREPLSVLQGPAIGLVMPGRTVRTARAWLTWTLRPTGTEVEGVPVRTLNRNWLTASVIVPSMLPDQARQPGERPEEHGLVFSSTRISMAILKANELLRRLSAAIAGAAQRTPMRFRHSA